MGRDLGLDGVVEHFTLVGDEVGWLRNKSGATRLGFAVPLKFVTWRGRFPRMRVELPADAVEHVAQQVGVSALIWHNKRRDEQARIELLRHMRAELIEPPTADRISTIVRSALHQGDERAVTEAAARLQADGCACRVDALVFTDLSGSHLREGADEGLDALTDPPRGNR